MVLTKILDGRSVWTRYPCVVLYADTSEFSLLSPQCGRKELLGPGILKSGIKSEAH